MVQSLKPLNMLQWLHPGLLLGRPFMDLDVFKSLRCQLLHLHKNYIVVLKSSKLLKLQLELLANTRPLKVIADTILMLKLMSWRPLLALILKLLLCPRLKPPSNLWWFQVTPPCQLSLSLGPSFPTTFLHRSFNHLPLYTTVNLLLKSTIVS